MSVDLSEISILRHGAAHVLAAAVRELYQGVQFAIGPAIDKGFYYDFKCDITFSTDDLEKIESKMREIIARALPFKKESLPKSEAIKLFREAGQVFKVELAEGIPDAEVTIYRIGDFVDLCRGPHVADTSCIPCDAFKLTSVSGAYWRGDSSRAALQRIYGVAFQTKEELEEHLEMLRESQARDHRKLGCDLEIFHIDESAPGGVFWLKNGAILFDLIKNYLATTIKKNGYYIVQTPQILNKSLWETSGHWDKFRENMFVLEANDATMAVKPMNCPGHIIVYKTGSVKSYRDLPIRMAEFGLCHRNEPSGSLHGLMRVRAFTQDDGHIFCTLEQVVSETRAFCRMLQDVYEKFGFSNITVKFSDRPAKRAGSDEVWDIAEKSLMDATDAAGLAYTVSSGDGAFYGPKLEFALKDSLGREWQCGTLQVDLVLPERFGIHYVDANGERQTPVMIHRAIVGSLERFIGILLEHHGGKLPFWLAPVQIAVATVTSELNDYASEVAATLQDAGFRVLLDSANEKITYKIRQYSSQKIPAIVVVGKKEETERTVSVRLLGSNENEVIALSNGAEYFEEISKKSENT
jgi:threonyl-tRNA synthetase